MRYQAIKASQTLLDPQNPRLPDGTSNDKEAINRLLREGFKQMLALAKDLTQRGQGNPSELPIVIPDGKKFIVLEGNRRFAVLKLLDNPKLADDRAHEKAFERLSRSGHAPPPSLYSAIAKDRDEADPWLTLRHTGANLGVGVRVWSAEQTARHRERMKAPVDRGTLRSVAIADELTEAYQADAALVDLITRVRIEKVTNIGRFFAGVTLTRMQFAMRQAAQNQPQTLWAKHTAGQLHSYFTWAFGFIAENSVDAYKNDTLRGALLNEYSYLLPDAGDSLSEHVRIADYPYSPTADSDQDGGVAEDEASPGSNQPSGTAHGDGHLGEDQSESDNPDDTGTGGRKRDQKPERFLYSQVKLPNLSTNTQRLLREVKSLPIDAHYAVTCVLARVILELTVSDPKTLAWSRRKESDSLAKKIRGCIHALDPEIDTPSKRTRQDLVQALLETNEIGVIYLHQFMHNPAAKADPHLARRFSAAFSPLLTSINEAVK